jgi:hypothetical protein
MATVKHIAHPATAEQILSTIRITKKDREVVNWVLAELGYDSEGHELEAPVRSTGTSGKKSAAKSATTKTATTAKAAKKVTTRESSPRKASK